jgi:hypothetical protein
MDCFSLASLLTIGTLVTEIFRYDVICLNVLLPPLAWTAMQYTTKIPILRHHGTINYGCEVIGRKCLLAAEENWIINCHGTE